GDADRGGSDLFPGGVRDWSDRGLPPPPEGHHWSYIDGNYVLIAAATGCGIGSALMREMIAATIRPRWPGWISRPRSIWPPRAACWRRCRRWTAS
ncbi:RcnB family protein, partial [Klebsiella pneumoniae]|nr:RcnB family protein [Klebsiella pneumoniae]